MCHADVSPEQAAEPVGAGAERVAVPLPSGETLPAQLVQPAEPGAPAVLLIADVFGPSPFYENLAARLCAEGFRVLLPDFFFRQGPLGERTYEAAFARRRELDEAGAVDDLRAAVAWLRDGEERVGVLGFCMGGTFALDLAALDPDLVTVAYYGFPVPQATLAFPPPAPLDLVDRMRGPILGFWGDQDETVGQENIERFVARMKTSEADFGYEILPGLGHGFLASAPLSDAGDDPAARTWELALAHYHRHLPVSSAV